MAFPSLTGTRRDSLSDAWRMARATAANVRERAQALRTSSAGGTLSAKDVVDFSTILADATDDWDRAKAVPGIAAYAQAQLNDNSVDIVAEFAAMQSAVTGVKTWITANFPKDASGWLLYVSFDANGRYTHRILTTGQTAGLRTQLDALIATID